jgi:hypothetical protein
VAPFGTAPLPVAVLVPAGVDLTRAVAGTGLQLADEGETVMVYATRDRFPLLFGRRAHDRWAASDVQLYLDLWAFPKRGREQAHHLRTSQHGALNLTLKRNEAELTRLLATVATPGTVAEARRA